MTLSPDAIELEALDKVERQLVAKGYTVIRAPRVDQLPTFMSQYQPDAIATGKKPNLLIEVVAQRGSSTAEVTKIEQLRKLVTRDNDWRLEIVYTSPSIPDLPVSSTATIRDRFSQIRALLAVDRPATLIMAWSLLEAVARALVPGRAERPMTPASAIELLASLGYVKREEADLLRDAGRARNLIVHGDLMKAISTEEIQPVLSIIDKLIVELDRRQIPNFDP